MGGAIDGREGRGSELADMVMGVARMFECYCRLEGCWRCSVWPDCLCFSRWPMPQCTCPAWPSSSRDRNSNRPGKQSELAVYCGEGREAGLVGCASVSDRQAGTWMREASANVMQRRRVGAVDTAV